jgi:chaperonin cofactor prefoldin
VDRRIERLEDSVQRLEINYNDLDRKSDRIEMGQKHLKELFEARLDTISASMGGQGTKIDALGIKLDGLLNTILRQNGDIESTPAGRQITAALREFQSTREVDEKRIDELEKKLYTVMGGVSVILGLITLFAPVIRRIMGLSD